MKTRGNNKTSKFSSASAIAATVAVITIALLIFLYRDQLTPPALRERFGLSGARRGDSVAYTFESGGGQVFAAAGDCLAVASTSGYQLLDKNGELAAHGLFSMRSPAIASFEGGAAFYDVGGTALHIAYENGDDKNLDREHTIISVSANKSGALTVITEKPGLKALLTVFNKGLEPAYIFESGTRRILGAQVSPKGDFVVVLCADEAGSSVLCFSLSAEEPIYQLSLPDELFFDIRYCGSSNIAILSMQRLLFIDASSGEQAGSYDFGSRRLSSYDLSGDGFVALVLGKYIYGTQEELITVSSSGIQRGTAELNRGADSVCAYGQRVLLLSGGSATLYNADLAVRGVREDALGFKKAILLKNGDCLLLTAFSAERFGF